MPEKSTPLVIPVVDVGKQSNSRASVDQVVDEVPLFTPTEQEFKNPMRYIEWITSRAGPFGICVVVPPESWKVGWFLFLFLFLVRFYRTDLAP